MRKGILCIMSLLCWFVVSAQVQTAGSMQAVQSIVKLGWDVQSYQTTYDEQTIVFAGKEKNAAQYDIYVASAQGTQWVDIHPLTGNINTENDEIWPTISSDEQTLFFVRVTPGKGKVPTQYHIMLSTKQAGGWSDPENIIITTGEDISPILMHDNRMVVFASNRLTATRKAHQFALYCSRRLNDHDWTHPELLLESEDKQVNLYAPEYIYETHTLRYTKQVCQKRDTTYTYESMALPERFYPEPVMTIQGFVRNKETGRGTQAEVKVFNAITSAPVTVLRTNAAGKFRVCLPKGNKYSLDITTTDHSHFYETFDCVTLTADTTIDRQIQLARNLGVRLHIFDQELSTPLRPDIVQAEGAKIKYTDTYVDMTLPIGKFYPIVIQKKGYTNDTLEIDTRKAVLLSESELDIELLHGKMPLSISLSDKDSLSEVIGRIELVNRNTGEKIIAQTSMRGARNLQVRQGNSYDVHVRAQGYVYLDTVINIPFSSEPMEYSLPLVALREQMVLQLRSIQFEYNSAALTTSSYDELDKVIHLLEDNPKLKIELSAHTDDHGSDAYNDKLSSHRGEAAKRYIVGNGISPERIKAVGYGKRKPLVENNSDENRAINRRVEFTILGL